MRYNLIPRGLSVTLSSLLYTAFSVHAAPCDGYLVTDLCEQSKSGPSEFHSISPGEGVTLGSVDNHFTFNGEGYELYYPQAHFAASVSTGVVRYTEVNRSYFTVSAHVHADDSTDYARAEKTTLNDSLMWILTSADSTTANGKSAVIVSTQFATYGSVYVQTKRDGSVFFAPILTHSRYFDTSYEMLWGIRYEAKNWDTKATSQYSVFSDASQQIVASQGHSMDAEFNDTASQRIDDQGLSTRATLNNTTTQHVHSGAEAQDTVLNHQAYTWARAGGALTGTTQANDAATIYLDPATGGGARAEKIILNGADTTLTVRHTNEAGAFVFVDNLVMQGGTVKFQHNGSRDYVNLQVGSLSGTGTLNFNTSIPEGKGNLLTIENGSGQYGVIVSDSGQEIASPQTQTLNLINDKTGGARFTLTSLSGESVAAVDGGTYLYYLKQQGGKDGLTGNVWYLGAQWEPQTDPGTEPEPKPEPAPEPEPGPGTDPVTRPGTQPITQPERRTTPSTDAILSMASANQFIFDGELQNLHMRKGDLRESKGKNAGVWGRYLSNDTRVNAGAHAAYRLQQAGIEIGADNVIDASTGHWLLGGFTAYSYNRLKHDRAGISDIDSYSLGVYATYFSHSGYYLDAVLKANQFNHTLNAQMTNGQPVNGDYRQVGLGGTLEAGYRYALAEKIFIDPYVRASYFHVDGKSISLSNGMTARLDNHRSAKGEVGVMLGQTFSLERGIRFSPYVKAAIEREFITSNNVRINQHDDFNNAVSGNVGKYGVGMDMRVADSTTVYLEANYRKGKQVETPVMANVGFRINF